MANVIVYSMAYRGDVYPFVPIASELSRRGHQVTFVVPQEFHADFAAEPFDCLDSGTDFGPNLLSSARHSRFVRRWGKALKGAMLGRKYFGELTAKQLDPLYDTLRQACVDTGAQLIITHRAAGIVSSMVAESLDIPFVTGDLFPMLVPSRFYPAPGMPNLGQKANVKTWELAGSRLLNPLTAANSFAKFRARKGLDAERQSPFEYGMSPDLCVGLSSPHYIRPAPDWPSNYVSAGFSFWAGPNNGQLRADVADFLNAGTPPVVVCLGTSAASAKPELFEQVRDVLNSKGERGLYLTSLTGTANSSAFDGPNHLAVPFAPLASVLPKAKAVVHSGAAGTNAMALAAGLPSVVVPVLFDQVWHAERQVELGTGLHCAKPNKIPAAIAQVLSDQKMADNCRRFAALIADEDGAVETCELVEELMKDVLA